MIFFPSSFSWLHPRRSHTITGTTTGIKNLCSEGQALTRQGQSWLFLSRFYTGSITHQFLAIHPFLLPFFGNLFCFCLYFFFLGLGLFLDGCFLCRLLCPLLQVSLPLFKALLHKLVCTDFAISFPTYVSLLSIILFLINIMFASCSTIPVRVPCLCVSKP